MASSRGILNIQSLNELTSENPILRMQNRHDFVCVDRGSIAAHGERPRRHNIQSLTSSRPRMCGFTSK